MSEIGPFSTFRNTLNSLTQGSHFWKKNPASKEAGSFIQLDFFTNTGSLFLH
ncbi:hypothetical protein C943_00068 [Mariniradius saccharolyticus AK6]|uniref:Uncharacterized protein n=1 Tax=Mariniradius saccharolyticus AK6 TaxID=1239962 RepID=M7XCZ1_9BACT|nr:hypothetical protein C943_00068 [Mariniradius saccharolyticus AK6]